MNEVPAHQPSSSMGLRPYWIVLVLIGTAVVYSIARTRQEPPEDASESESPAAAAHAAAGALPSGITAEEWQEAGDLFYVTHGREPDRFEQLWALANLAREQQQLDREVAALLAIPLEHPVVGTEAWLRATDSLIEQDRSVQAEATVQPIVERLEALPDLSPPQVKQLAEALEWQRYLFAIELRFEERHRVLQRIHQLHAASIQQSKVYCFPLQVIWNAPHAHARLLKFLARDPESTPLRIAHGRYLVGTGKIAEGRDVLERIHQQDPNDLNLLAALLECHFESGDDAAFTGLASQLPPFDAAEPWLLTQMRATAALEAEQWPEAEQYCRHLLAAVPTHPQALVGLTRALEKQGGSEEVEQLRHRTLVLARIRPELVNVTEQNAAGSLTLADDCDSVRLFAAAEIFREHAARIAANEHSSGPTSETVAEEALDPAATRP